MYLLVSSLGVLPLELNKLLIIVVVLSMALTPLLNEVGRRAAEFIEDKFDTEDVSSVYYEYGCAKFSCFEYLLVHIRCEFTNYMLRCSRIFKITWTILGSSMHIVTLYWLIYWFFVTSANVPKVKSEYARKLLRWTSMLENLLWLLDSDKWVRYFSYLEEKQQFFFFGFEET